ncbi:MAG: TonB-dependent receptor domain-containing protein, partial [Novosphingobium sp.]
VAAGAVIFAAPAYAQETTETEQPQAAPADEGAIVVTGSRIRSVTPFNSPDPISIVDPEIAKKEGRFDLASTLQSSPIAAGSTQITAALSSNFVTNGGPGAQTVDLRGLGANRPLVLLNGRRAGPAGTRGGVSSFDLNVLPLSIINDIQILKTGASSVYGSDAVAGVVNILTKSKLDGLSLNANSSLPFDGGGEEYRFSAAWGKTFDRGHILIAGDYSKTKELARGDREYLACPAANIFDEAGNPADLIDPRTGKPHCEDLRWGHVWTYNATSGTNLRLDGPGGPNTGLNTVVGPSVLMQFQYPGQTLGIPAFGAPAFFGDFFAPAGWFPTGYDAKSMAVQNAYHPFVDEQTIIPETDLYTVYAEGSFELSESVELFGEFLFNRRETYQNGWRQFWNFGYTGDLYGTGAGNAYNFWGGGWGGLNLLSPTGITNLNDSSQKVDYYRGVAGARGNFGGDSKWRYDVHAQFSRNIGRYRSQQILQDAYDTGYFQFASCAGTVTPISGKQCIDLPWANPNFLAGQLTPAQAAFLTDWEEGKTIYTQLSGEATVSGELFQLPAGPLDVAIGGSIREDKINDKPGAITLAANAWGASASGITAGKSLTTEAFAEVNIPLLKDKTLFQDLTLSAAGRVTNVKATKESNGVTDEDNGNWTYKVGLNWTVTDWLRFRGSYGTSYRAPALFEQFLADETSFLPQNRIDPCVNWTSNLAAGRISQRIANNCAADGIPGNYAGGGISATVVSSGGLGILEAETSKALVIGTILTPKLSFLPDTDISLAVDFFDIKVAGEISQLGAGTILFGCYDSANFATEPLCDLVTRGQNVSAPFQINRIRDSYINVSSQHNQGIDLNFRAKHDLGKLGTVTLTADMTWQLKDNSRLLPTSPLESDNGEAGSPQWVGDFRLTWAPSSSFSVFYGMSVIGGTSNQQDFLDRNGGPCLRSFNNNRTATPLDDVPIYGVYCPDLTAPAVFYHNVSVTKEIADGRFQITAGINNLFDTRPPRVSVLNGNQISMLGPVVAASQYGFAGRRVFVNVGAKF